MRVWGLDVGKIDLIKKRTTALLGFNLFLIDDGVSMRKHICIYCKKEKDESQFNREHVVPRMMGTYENGFVLSNNEVCEEDRCKTINRYL